MGTPLSKEQWEAWQTQPETLAFKAYLKAEIALAKDAWAAGELTAGRNAQDIAVANLAAVENVRFAQRVIDLDYDDVVRITEEVVS
ncbi:hypothetical protein H0X91_18035 [Burkholderia sp. 9777_1386]|uniref:hypothetical protein n=1 Tax=Burkholderia sp. 9777_1386 TaxID=2751183 RepID=UPI0018C39782|nr:hypothetical protein [Burkholderia sp. 9777_1386]MBG0871871.1 hypothetical protein [Burkholderia sp. 9777_1386]